MTKQWKRFLALTLTVCMLLGSVVCASADGSCPWGHPLDDGNFCDTCGRAYGEDGEEEEWDCSTQGHDWDSAGYCEYCSTYCPHYQRIKDNDGSFKDIPHKGKTTVSSHIMV